ncbi:glycosyltransferase 87 family protein [Corynebacterium sp.]|uniref:glycosyltransferase 87 family protein n=1 Tax=Corynebacterium sp. TaxID=1720 RepID=UPI0026E0F9D3|nr:glycosyltransferase 87 family protein [Corynebacterium sp.]MDO5511680.1 glycosyltransferase 87 family protein [Corynebacterium sp.]
MFPRSATLLGAPTLIAALLWLGAWMAQKETHVVGGWHLGLRVPTDLQVYLLAGDRLNEGGLLYDSPLLGELPFTYPPFAAGVFRWLSTLTPELATIVWQTSNLLALIAVILMCFAERRRPVAFFAVLLAVAFLATEPIRGSFFYGQINLILMLLVAWDVLPKNNRFAGVGIGIAAGLKLTPAFFVIIFLVQRRFKAAAVSAGTFLLTVIAGFFVVPDAGTFWLDSMFNSERVGVHENPGAQSIKSLLVRNAGIESGLLWLALALLVTALTAAAAWLALRRGNRTVALALTGLGACLVSPFSWYHHWVWIVPLTVAVIAAIDSLADARGFLIAQLSALVTLAALFVLLLPYVSGVLWPEMAYPGPVYLTDNALWRQAFTGYGVLMILGYLLYAGALELKSRPAAAPRPARRPPRRDVQPETT